jgi:uncharacterized membrane protein YeaQ/YmgE (transglycosylase-associated protein family)
MMILGANVPMPESPQGKFWSWIVGIVAATMGTWLFLDGYFAHRAEAVTKAEAETMIVAANTAQATAINAQTAYLIDQQTKRAIDTKLFELEQIPPAMLKPQDRALYQKLQRDRAEMVDYWIKQGRPLR